uniref:Uncharacterized protein n=1 Tax=Chelydra serpentina TaxID=8475 RepID=A0A8C3XPV9_CHESE
MEPRGPRPGLLSCSASVRVGSVLYCGLEIFIFAYVIHPVQVVPALSSRCIPLSGLWLPM